MYILLHTPDSDCLTDFFIRFSAQFHLTFIRMFYILMLKKHRN
jgi:hypothetical protein